MNTYEQNTERLADIFVEYVERLTLNRMDSKSRESKYSQAQKVARDNKELYFMAKEIGCDRELLK